VRIALVGPTHPYKGGVAAHTTQTAHELARAAAGGHDVELVSWSKLYPERLYPGEQAVPDGGPDLPPFEPTTRPLRWDRPWSWVSTGRHLRRFDLVVVVVVVPVQVPALLALVAAAKAGRGRRGGRPRVVVIAHNVVPHETHPGGEWLITRMLRAADAVVVHSPEQARLAEGLGVRRVDVAALAPHPPGGLPVPIGRERALSRPAPVEGEPVRVLALGMVRHYKGYDQLLDAARSVPGVSVTVAGEQWGQAGERVRQAAADPALAGRVELRPGYLPGAEVPGLLAAHDVLALPYRHATASQNAFLGHAHGLPVLATRVGTFEEEVRDGVDGLLVPPDDVPALTAALRRLTEPGVLPALRAGLPELDVEKPWHDYVETLTKDVVTRDVAR
jgi:glycosyltransferase involved in cell wall biosynthesis